jgi:hypothetical protein
MVGHPNLVDPNLAPNGGAAKATEVIVARRGQGKQGEDKGNKERIRETRPIWKQIPQ